MLSVCILFSLLKEVGFGVVNEKFYKVCVKNAIQD